jgi:hypothetical protein
MKKWTILGSGLCMAALAACSSSSSVGTGNDAGKTDSSAKTDAGTGMKDGGSSIDPSTWTAASSWSVKAPGDAGMGSSDPYAIVMGGGTSAYVLRNLSNVIDVIDTSATSDAGVVTSSIDLSSLVQSGDADGLVEVTAGFYDPTRQLVYVVLGNINTFATLDYMGNYDTICVGTTSTVVAIDTTTNTLKPLGGTGMGGSIALLGYDPTSIVYDAANDRVLIVEAGCNPEPATDGGAPGPLRRRGVEAVALAGGTTAVLLDNSTQGFPGSFVYVGPHQAVVGFSYPTYQAFAWDPTTPTLGTQYANAPQVFDYDGSGNLVGVNVNYGADGGVTVDTTSMSLASGMAVKLVSNAAPPGTDYVGSVGVWPRP